MSLAKYRNGRLFFSQLLSLFFFISHGPALLVCTSTYLYDTIISRLILRELIKPHYVQKIVPGIVVDVLMHYLPVNVINKIFDHEVIVNV